MRPHGKEVLLLKRMLCSLVILLCLASSCPAAQTVSVMLDWIPNVDHLPLFVAKERGFFREEGLEVRILAPSDTADALKLAAAARVDLAISYAPQVVVSAAEGVPLAVVGRLMEHPLSTLLFLEGRGIQSPSDLSGKKIGYTVPGVMDVLLDAFAKLNGVKKVAPVNVGVSIVQSLASGKVDAVMGGFRNYEVVEMLHQGMKPATFPLEKWGIPDYDELVFVTSPNFAKSNPNTIRAFRKALSRGIHEALANPQKALETYFRAVPEAPRDLERDTFAKTLPFFARSQKLDPARWERFAAFALRWKLIGRPVDVKTLLWKDR